MRATPPAANPSNMISSSFAPCNSPVPRLIARSMLSAGMFTARAFWMSVRRAGLEATSFPDAPTTIMISLAILLKILPFLASAAPFLCLILAHLL